MLVECISVARVRPRTSKGITDLLLPPSSFILRRSRSLTELTRQITPPTKNGHAPPPIESRKNSQSVNPHYVWTCLATILPPEPKDFDFSYSADGFVFQKSKNFTSDNGIRIAPTVPINHFSGAQTNKIVPKTYFIIPC
ncbi:hypothetical protein ACHAXS_006584 [Conticribra weissflogii]